MRIGVLSDTHVSQPASVLGSIHQKIRNTRALDDLRVIANEHFQQVDLIVHAGDFVHIAVLEMLRECAPVEAVYGNMDSAEVCAQLPETRILDIAGHKIGIVHGNGGPQGIVGRVKAYFQDKPMQAIIFGHTHQPLNERRANILFFNPGSPTDRIFAPYNSVGIIELDDTIEGKIIRL